MIALHQILWPHFICMKCFRSHLDKAQLVQLLCTLTADQKDYTDVCSMTDLLVFKYGTMIVYCIKHRNKFYMYVNPFDILSTQKTDLAKVAVVLFMFLIYSLK